MLTKEQWAAKRAARADRLEAAADRAKARSNTAYGAQKEILDRIPPGQPILIGHHSEKRHRRDLGRADDLMRRSYNEGKKAERLADAAEAARNNRAIFSDDPEALDKLRASIARAEAAQDIMKKANKLIKSGQHDALRALLGEDEAHRVLNPRWGGAGYQGYQLTNNSANIRRMKERLAGLERTSARESREYTINGVRVLENTEANRLQIFFDDKPEESRRKKLKSNGFKWSPSNGAWQRQLNTLGRHARRYAERALLDE